MPRPSRLMSKMTRGAPTNRLASATLTECALVADSKIGTRSSEVSGNSGTKHSSRGGERFLAPANPFRLVGAARGEADHENMIGRNFSAMRRGNRDRPRRRSSENLPQVRSGPSHQWRGVGIDDDGCEVGATDNAADALVRIAMIDRNRSAASHLQSEDCHDVAGRARQEYSDPRGRIRQSFDLFSQRRRPSDQRLLGQFRGAVEQGDPVRTGNRVSGNGFRNRQGGSRRRPGLHRLRALVRHGEPIPLLPRRAWAEPQKPDGGYRFEIFVFRRSSAMTLRTATLAGRAVTSGSDGRGRLPQIASVRIRMAL